MLTRPRQRVSTSKIDRTMAENVKLYRRIADSLAEAI